MQRFVAEREVEAPDFFQAIQSYRAAMAVLRQLSAFTRELYQGGGVDEGERDAVLAELGTRERRLEITGPVWKPPRPGAVLRSLPFLRCLPRPRLERTLAAGRLLGACCSQGGLMFLAARLPASCCGIQRPPRPPTACPPPSFSAELKRGEVFWQAEAPAAAPDALAGQGLFVVLSGAVCRCLRRPDGDAKVCRRAGVL